MGMRLLSEQIKLNSLSTLLNLYEFIMFSRSSGIREKLTHKNLWYIHIHVCESTESSVHEIRHCCNSHPTKIVTKLQRPTLFFGLACFCQCT